MHWTLRRTFWGVALVLTGLLILASNLGYLRPFSVWGLWPILIIWPALKLLFVGAFVEVGGYRRWTRVRLNSGIGFRLVALWVLAGAVAQLLYNLSLIPYDWGDIAYRTAPALLVGLGIALLLRPRRRGWEWAHKERTRGHYGQGVSSFVGDLNFGTRPWTFKSPMTIDLWAGDIDMDLTTAEFAPGDNYLWVHAWAGDVTIRAPQGIDVAVEAHASAGELRVFDEERSGLSVDLKVKRGAEFGPAAPPEPPAGANGTATPAQTPRLFIGIDLTFGNVRVR